MTDRPASASRQSRVRPRDAATLIALRQRSGKRLILLGQRPARARFMPGRYVFPGGAVSAGDGGVSTATPLDAAYVTSMAVGGSCRRATRLALAAVRETYEETGLLLGVPGRTEEDLPLSWRRFFGEGLMPSLQPLRYVGRAITPTFSEIRYHARFFLTNGEGMAGEIARGDGELENVRWVEESEISHLEMAEVTRFMLDRALSLSAGKVVELPAPVFSWRRNKRSVVWR
ncbi:MAG: NUDIX hydrolase [Pseudomonadota bacterium]|nr:NUDIX hydrolase [Pseudomonadota bacterium]